MLGQYTFGLKPIEYSEITSSEIYFGDEVGGKSTAAQAGAIDLKAGNQMYSLKARFNVYAVGDFAPADNGGTKGVVTVTPTVTTAGAGTLALKVCGKTYNVTLAETDTTATKVCTAIKNQILDDEWEITGTATAVFTQKNYFAYTYAASDWTGTFVADTGSSGAYTTASASTTAPVAPTGYGITYTLQHCDTKTGTYVDLVSAKVPCDLLVQNCEPAFEITMPSNCKRFVRLKVQGEASGTAGKILCAIEPKN